MRDSNLTVIDTVILNPDMVGKLLLQEDSVSVLARFELVAQ